MCYELIWYYFPKYLAIFFQYGYSSFPINIKYAIKYTKFQYEYCIFINYYTLLYFNYCSFSWQDISLIYHLVYNFLLLSLSKFTFKNAIKVLIVITSNLQVIQQKTNILFLNKIVIFVCTNIAYSSISSAKIYTRTYMHIHCYYRDYSIFIPQFLWRRSYDTHIAESMLSWNFNFGKRKQRVSR